MGERIVWGCRHKLSLVIDKEEEFGYGGVDGWLWIFVVEGDENKTEPGDEFLDGVGECCARGDVVAGVDRANGVDIERDWVGGGCCGDRPGIWESGLAKARDGGCADGEPVGGFKVFANVFGESAPE